LLRLEEGSKKSQVVYFQNRQVGPKEAYSFARLKSSYQKEQGNQ